MDNELNRFKTEINIINYAASLGYQIDKQKYSRSCTILRKDDAKIGISTDLDNHGVFFDFRKEKGGSIIDFVKSETGKNLGQVRQILRPWIGLGCFPPKQTFSYLKPLKTSKDRQKVAIKFAKTKLIDTHRYIEIRGIKQGILKAKRFLGKIYIDNFGNVIFPYYDHDGIIGFSIINQNYKGFSQNGERGLLFSNYYQDDNRMVICESVIDVLSYHILKGDNLTCYFSIDGQLTQKQVMLIDGLVPKNQNKKIVFAFDNDNAGRNYISLIKKQHKEVHNITVDLPEKDG